MHVKLCGEFWLTMVVYHWGLHGQFDDDKRKAGWAWLDEKAHGEERAYKARQLALQERNDLKTSISLGFALIALVISGVALYRSSWPQNIPTPPPITQRP
jgi:hypothetical protein